MHINLHSPCTLYTVDICQPDGRTTRKKARETYCPDLCKPWHSTQWFWHSQRWSIMRNSVEKCKFVVWDGYVWSRANQSGHSIPKAWFSRFNLVSTIRCGEKVLFTVKQALHQARSCFENGIETVVTFLLRVLMYYPNWRKWKEYGSYHLQSSPLVQALIIEPGK